MYDINHFLRELKTFYLQSREGKRVAIKMDRAMISITFDDVPRNVMTNGVPILDSFNIKATFYVAMGLSNSNIEDTNNKNHHGVFLTPADIVELNRCDHDIACHTYSHYMLDKGTAENLAVDAQKNVRELSALLDLKPIDHFAYPYGQVNFRLKKLLSRNYKTMRSTRPGINQASADMYLLRANGLGGNTFDKEKIKLLIQKAECSRGWLIFYIHGVRDKADAYNCTPDQIEWLARECKSSDAEILTIYEAYNRLIKTDA